MKFNFVTIMLALTLLVATLACIPVMFILLLNIVSNPDIADGMKAVSCGLVLITGMLIIGENDVINIVLREFV